MIPIFAVVIVIPQTVLLGGTRPLHFRLRPGALVLRNVGDPSGQLALVALLDQLVEKLVVSLRLGLQETFVSLEHAFDTREVSGRLVARLVRVLDDEGRL